MIILLWFICYIGWLWFGAYVFNIESEWWGWTGLIVSTLLTGLLCWIGGKVVGSGNASLPSDDDTSWFAPYKK